MNYKLLLYIIIVIIPKVGMSQVYGNDSAPLGGGGGGTGMRVATIEKLPDHFDDSFFLTTEWNEGSIYLENGQIIKSCTLRCDLGNEYVEIKDNEIIRGVAFRDIDEFQIEEEDGKFTRYYCENEFLMKVGFGKGVYEVLIDGPDPLFLNTSVDILKSNGGFTDLQRADKGLKSIRSEKYYIIKENETIEIKGKSSLVSACGNRGEEVKKWVKTNHKNPKGKRDLIDIWTFYLSIK